MLTNLRVGRAWNKVCSVGEEQGDRSPSSGHSSAVEKREVWGQAERVGFESVPDKT